MNLSTKYMGLTLKNPIVVGSSGLTNTIDHLKELEQNGAGAVVLKSIFEEQIRIETDKFLKNENKNTEHWKSAFQQMVDTNDYLYEEALSYITDFAKSNTLDVYLNFIKEAKKAISIPVIASINCISPNDWQYFAKKIQDAGADALELNVYVLPSDFEKTAADNHKIYFDIIEGVKKYVTIPVALKVGYYFSDLAYSLKELSKTGIASLVLFNRPFNPDINIDTLEMSHANMYSLPNDYAKVLRWVGILSGKIECEISATTGVHDSETIIKYLLSGADTVQVCSVLYKHGFGVIKDLLAGIEKWMEKHNYKSIDEFKGKLAMKNIENPAAYERVQFMKLYSKIE